MRGVERILRPGGRRSVPVSRPSLHGAAGAFSAAVDLLPAYCFVVDARGRFRWANAATLGLEGLSWESVVNRPAEELPPLARNMARGAVIAAVTGRPSRLGPLQLPSDTRMARWATGVTFPITSGDHRLGAACFMDLGQDSAGDRSSTSTVLGRSATFVLATDTDLRVRLSAGAPMGPLSGQEPRVGDSVPDLLASVGADERGEAAMRAALEGHELIYRSHHGRARLENWVGPRRDVDGRVTGTVTVTMDVTTSESAHHREQRAEERFRRLVEHSPALIGIYDAEERLVHANPAFLHAFGHDLRSALGRTGADLIPGYDDDLHDTVRTVRTESESRVWEGRLVHPSGDPVHLLGHVFPLQLADGSGGVGEVFLDVTPRDRALRELVASEQRYRAIFDGAAICIILLDAEARIVDANAASKQITGRSRSELLGRFVGAITTPKDTEAHLPLWRELISGARSRYDQPMTLRHADGTLCPAHLTMTLIRDDAGHPTGALGLATPYPAEQPPARSGRVRGVMTAPETAVLERLAAGESLAEIADDLGLTRRGVDYRVSQLRRKLRADGPGGVPATATALVARAYALGIMHPSAWPPRVIEPST